MRTKTLQGSSQPQPARAGLHGDSRRRAAQRHWSARTQRGWGGIALCLHKGPLAGLILRNLVLPHRLGASQQPDTTEGERRAEAGRPQAGQSHSASSSSGNRASAGSAGTTDSSVTRTARRPAAAGAALWRLALVVGNERAARWVARGWTWGRSVAVVMATGGGEDVPLNLNPEF